MKSLKQNLSIGVIYIDFHGVIEDPGNKAGVSQIEILKLLFNINGIN